MYRFSIILTAILKILFAKQCANIQEEFTIYPTVDETYEWDIRKNFFTGENLAYYFKPECPYFDIIHPIEQISDPQTHQYNPSAQIKALKPLTSSELGVWLNDFIFLEQTITEAIIFLALGDPQSMSLTPNFNTSFSIRNLTHKLTCFDLDFLQPTVIIVDCYQSDLRDQDNGYTNQFVIINITDPDNYYMETNKHATGYNYNYTEVRKIQFQNFTYAIGPDGKEIKKGETLPEGWREEIKQYLFRVEPAWATEKAFSGLDNDCVLEIYEFSNNKLVQSNPVKILSKIEMSILLNQTYESTIFPLIDFQLFLNGDIYVQADIIAVLRISASGEWSLMQSNKYCSASCYGFNSYQVMLADGSYHYQNIFVFQSHADFYENNHFKYSISLPKTTSYTNFQVFIGQQFIVFRIQQFVYLFDSKDGTLIYIKKKYLNRNFVFLFQLRSRN